MDTTTSVQAPTESAGRCRGDSGASLIEYALLLALIVIVCIGAVTVFGGNLDDSYSKSTSSMFSR
jgi:Flp pilus assembly pilin Flp